jgi:LPXTG-site transpeptidase (sortase) family protein
MKDSLNIVAFAGMIIVCGILFLSPKPQVEVVQAVKTLPISEPIDHGPTYPVKISIESIGVFALIEPVGLSNGAMSVPKSSQDVGWYSLGPKPGDIGSAVIDGHVNWMDGGDAVFTHLDDIKIGDIVSITNNYGYTDKFIVRDIKDYPVDADTSDVFLSTDGGRYLNLITCTGTWNEKLETHNSRLVVFTEKINNNN